MFSLDECMLEGIKSVRICRPAPHLPTSSSSISLETVASYVLELEVEVGERKYSSITLREVPSFLLEAFRDLRSRGLDVEGLFRKEGNWNRLKNIFPVYFGCVGIPRECNVHDICSMIKRFFRELKTPLFAHLESKLIDIASICEDGEIRRRRLLDAVLMLPPSHLGTLAYLLRQLKYFGDHHEGHHMTVENLSRVFAPTLFREGSLNGQKKKKKITQKPLYTVMRDDTDLKILIVNELIENAAKVGVPRDCYIFSRRPSDLNYYKTQARKTNSQVNTSARSSSAKPLSRNSFSQPATFASGDALKDKKMEKAKHKGREGRRSSSTVREIFSSISSISTKVLRRAASPSRILGRRTSADVIALNNAHSMDRMSRLSVIDSLAGPSFEQRMIGDENRDIPSFENEEAEEEQSKTIIFDPEEEQCEEKTCTRTELVVPKTLLLPTTEDPNTSTGSQRRSRRESPRKHLTANSRVKPVTDPMMGINWWPASPAFEPPQMSMKPLSEVVLKRKESEEKKEKKIRDSKIVKRNSSKSNTEALDANHIALSFLEEYDVNKMGLDRRRRHTAPLKNSILKRNQPNTIATGLKNVHVRVRDRRALTLSFRSSTEEPSRRVDKMKRRSESLGGESSDRSQISEDENTAANLTSLISATALLEQKNTESRQRRAKRKKRKEKGSGGVEEVKIADSAKQTESPSGSLLDDVTNALERLERERRPTVDRGTQCNEFRPRLSTSLSASPDISLFKATGSKSIVPALDAHTSPTISLATSAFSPPLPKKASSIGAVENGSSFKISQSSRVYIEKNGDAESRLHCSSATFERSFKTPLASSNRISPKKDPKGHFLFSNVSAASDEINEETFAHSELYKKQILTRQKDEVHPSGQLCANARPSVAFIKNNNRGMVKQRVNQFAQLESQHLMDSFSSRSSQNSLCPPSLPCEFTKPSAPPVTHGLRPAERRATMSPPSVCSTASSRTKLSDVSSTTSSPRFSPPTSSQKSFSPLLRVASSTPSRASQASNSPRESAIFTPLARRKTKQ